MVTNCVRWILFPFCFLLGIVSVAASNTNCNPELNVSDTLWWSASQSRLTFDVHPDHSAVSICGLQAGEKYSLVLHALVPEARGRVEWSTPGVETRPKTDEIREFIAQEDCANIQLSSALDDRVASTFSLGCLSCKKQVSQTASAAGILVNPNFTAQELIEDVFISGNCFSVASNSIRYDGNGFSPLAYFQSGISSVNIEEGLMLSTGAATNAEGSNSFNNRTSELQSSFFADIEPDLEELINYSSGVYDVAILEFDFIPTSPEVSFDYVFASEEYCEYVDSEYNDVFGFFISGPGINGPFSNGAENIAQIPGSTDYITINSVNHNSNEPYYVNNIPADHFNIFPLVANTCSGYPQTNNPANSEIEFDGFTTVLTAKATVIPCETYHIKLAIADVSDRRYDSAVFLKANSFSSGGSALADTELPDAFGGFALEGCIGGNFVFERQDSEITEPLTVHYTVSSTSTALAGIDYAPLPDSIIIPAGENFFYLPVEVYTDAIVEGTETLILELEAPCSCSTPFVEMNIADAVALELNLTDQEICEPSLLEVEALPIGGLANYSFTWNTGDTTSVLSVFPQGDTRYYVTVTDFCGAQISDSVAVHITGIPEATISGDFEICPQGDPAFLEILFSQTGTYTVNYSINGLPQPPINNITDNPFILATSIPGEYELIAVENSSCIGITSGLAKVDPLDFGTQNRIDSVSCPGADDGSIVVQVNGGLAPYSYEWGHTSDDTPSLSGLSPGQYDLTITEAGGCTFTQQYQIGLSTSIPFAQAGNSTPLSCSKTEIFLIADGSVGGPYSYLWTTPDGNILSGGSSLMPLVNKAGTYQLEVSNNETGCKISDEVVVGIDTIAPIPVIVPLGPTTLSCMNDLTLLDGNSSQPQGNISLLWSSVDGLVPVGQNTAMQVALENAGTYQLLVTNSLNGCTAFEEIVIEADTTLPQSKIAIPELLTCRDSTLLIDARGSSSGAMFSYRWSTSDGNMLSGMTDLELLVDAPGWYHLEVSNSINGCQSFASVEVKEDKVLPIAEAGATEDIDCDSPEVMLDGSASSQGGLYQYLWTTLDGNLLGDSSTLLSLVNTQGTYDLLVTNKENGCTASDVIFVFENTNRPNDLMISTQAPLCFGDFGSFEVREVMGGEEPFLYSFDEGQSFSTEVAYDNLYSGNYELIVQDVNGCEFSKSFVIPTVSEKFVLLDPEVIIQLGELGSLSTITNIPNDLIDSIIWSPTAGLTCTDCLDPEVEIFEDTRYQVTVVDTNGCVASDETLLRVRKDRNVFIPNAFSPNGDGANDFFFVHADPYSVRKINVLRIYNRWGEQLFESKDALPNDPLVGWDGFFKGQVLNPAVYTFYAELEFVDGVKQLYKGDVSLIR